MSIYDFRWQAASPQGGWSCGAEGGVIGGGGGGGRSPFNGSQMVVARH